MSLLHRYAEYCGVYPMKSQDIGRVEIHFFDIVPLGKIPGIPGQFEDFFPDGHFPAYGIQIIALHIIILPCRPGQLQSCQMLLRLQKSYIHDIALSQLLQGDCLAVFIRIARSPVHGQGILLPKIQIQQCDSVVNTVDIHQYSRIRRIIAVRIRHHEAGIHSVGFFRCLQCYCVLYISCSRCLPAATY